MESTRGAMMRSLKLVCLFLSLASVAQAQQNGITVGQPKAYDNRSLTIMLDQLNTRLQQLQIVDQASLAKALGTFQGSQVTDQSFSFSAAVAPPMAAGSGTGGSQGASNSGSSGSGSSGSSGSGSSGSGGSNSGSSGSSSSNSGSSGSGGGSSKSSGSSSSGGGAAAPSLPDLIATPGFTPQFNESAGDLLSDQIDLTYQIFNLRMLLERSLTDRLLPNGHTRRQAVLSFNITIDPPKDASDAAAYVEIKISNAHGPLSLVAAMPQEKTYNATALSTKSTAFSGSAVAKIITVGANFRRRGQTFFLYRDSDTLALERPQTADNALTFGWVFRPVLGRRSVSPGMRQLFVVVSLPDDDEPQAINATNLAATATTYWRHYDKKSSTTTTKAGFWDRSSKRLPKPENITLIPVDVPSTSVIQADLAPRVSGRHWYPTGKGTSTIEVDGKNFFIGTTVTLGNKLLATPQDGLFIKSDQTLVITVSDDVVNSAFGAFVNGRYGGTVPLFTPPAPGLVIRSAAVAPRGAGVSDLQLTLSSLDDSSLRTNDIASYPAPILFLNGTLVQIRPTLRTQLREDRKWDRNTSYELGTTVVPRVGNGHSYTCITAGRSGDNPPAWSTATGSTFADGTVAWQEDIKTDIVASYRLPNSFLKGRDNQITIAFPLLGKNWSADAFTYDDKAVVLTKIGGNDKTSTTLMLSRPGVEMSGDWEIVLDQTYEVDAAPTHPPAKVKLSRPVPCAANRGPGCYVLRIDADSTLLKDFKKMLLVDPDGFAQIVDLSPPPSPTDPPKITGPTSDAVKEGETPTVAFKGSGLRGIRQVSFQGKQLPFSINDDGTQLQVLLSRDVTGKQGHQELQLDSGKSLLTGIVNVAPAPKSATPASASSDKKGQDSNE